MKLLSRRWLVLFVVLFLSATSLLAAGEKTPGILFLLLRLKDGAFSLVSATNVPGVLKTPRGSKPRKEFQLVVEDAEGKAFWTEEMADPAVEWLEYADPAQPGFIRVKEVRRTEAEFTVRVPATPGKQHLAIYRRAAATANAGQKTLPARDLVARLALP